MSNLFAEPNRCQIQGEWRDIWSFLIAHSNIVQIMPYYRNNCTVNDHKVEWRHKLFKRKQNRSVANNLLSGKYSIKVKGEEKSKRSIFRGCCLDSKFRNTAFEIYSTTKSILGFSFGFRYVFRNVEILRTMKNHTPLEYDPPS